MDANKQTLTIKQILSRLISDFQSASISGLLFLVFCRLDRSQTFLYFLSVFSLSS
jgi:hypothetical protein